MEHNLCVQINEFGHITPLLQEPKIQNLKLIVTAK